MDRMILYTGFNSFALFESENSIGASNEKLAEDDVKFSVDVRDITKIDSKIFQLNTIQSVVILR